MDEISTGGGFTGGDGGENVNPGADFMNLLGIGSQPESVIIKGENFDQMKNLATDIRGYIENLNTISSVNMNVQDNKPEVHLLFNMDYLGRNNLSLMNLSQALSSFSREYSIAASNARSR